MLFFKTVTAAAFAVAALPLISSAPIPDENTLAIRQNAGTGAACDSVFSDFDTGTGEMVENAEDNTADNISKAKGGRYRRQNAGTGAGCNSVFSDFDTGTGEMVENAEDNTASAISGGKYGQGGSSGGSSAPASGGNNPAPPKNGPGGPPAGGPPAGGPGGPGHKRQLNKWSDGAGQVIDAAGSPTLGSAVASNGDTIDGDGTNDLADTGAAVGQLELDIFPSLGSAVPKSRRQLNKWSDGAGQVLDAAGAPSLGTAVSSNGDTIDGDGTNDLANAGAAVGNEELAIFPSVGAAVPRE